MIKECVIWEGRMVSTYQDEVEEWMNQADKFGHIRYSPADLEEVGPGDERFADASLFGDLTVLITNAQQWDAATAQKALGIYSDMLSGVRVGLIYAGGVPSKNTVKFATEPVRERYIPFDPDDMASWTKEWLAKRNVTVSRKDAAAIASHVGEDVDALVKGIGTLAATKADQTFDPKTDMSAFGEITGADVFHMIGSINKGNPRTTLELLTRILNQGDYSVPAMLAMITSTFRAYVALSHDKNVDLEAFGINERRAYYVRREAASVNKTQGLAIMEALYVADRKSYGGSNLSENDILTTLIIKLSKIFKR